MRYIRNIFFCTFLLFVNFPNVIAKTVPINEESINDYMNKFIIDCTKGMLTANPEIIVSYYSEDIRLMPAFQKTLLGKENASIYHKAFFERFNILKYKRENLEILDLGSQFSVLGTFTMKIQLKSTKQIKELKGKYMDIWEKEEGKFSLISEIWNYNHHTDFTEHLKFNNVPGTVLAYQEHLPINNDIRFELAALNRFMEEFISQGDHKLWSQLYTNDVISMFSYKPMYLDKESLDTFLKYHVAELPIFEKLDIRNNHIDDLGTYIVNYASHIANWRNDDYSGISTGKGIKIWRRQSNGSLKIVRQIATYDYNY
ncbi:nuclear transport factor 2 family protein [uncultured Aquimarina sp.]|uniref:nuclear transport factor 2 family protein n=1 Tax=uncultured Aquimarina sp. TaxID=575652 RepID=UPI00263381F4|nr:nuclear transport factor 2 family protein [uncultured Aquimarina sp.]